MNPGYDDKTVHVGSDSSRMEGTPVFACDFYNTSFEFFVQTTTDGKMLSANQSFLDGFGYKSQHAVTGVHLGNLFLDASEFIRVQAQLLQQNHLRNERFSFLNHSGDTITVLMNASIVSDKNGYAVFNWAMLDISKFVETEESLKRKNEELVKVRATMEKFLYSTSHDLRSPVSSILGLINLIRVEKPDHQLHGYIEKIEICASRLDTIIRDLMGFTKTSYQRTKTSRISLRETLDRIIGRYTAHKNFEAISFDLHCEQHLEFYSDRERIDLILDNLVRNALTFFDLNKTRPFVRIAATLNCNEVRIEFLDNGLGIGQSHQEKIFDMFYRASETSQGAGLGLYIVKESLQQLGGSISVESEPGFGSLFRIVIPNPRVDHQTISPV